MDFITADKHLIDASLGELISSSKIGTSASSHSTATRQNTRAPREFSERGILDRIKMTFLKR